MCHACLEALSICTTPLASSFAACILYCKDVHTENSLPRLCSEGVIKSKYGVINSKYGAIKSKNTHLKLFTNFIMVGN